MFFFFLLFFRETKSGFIMRIVCCADDSHERLNIIFFANKNIYIHSSMQEI